MQASMQACKQMNHNHNFLCVAFRNVTKNYFCILGLLHQNVANYQSFVEVGGFEFLFSFLSNTELHQLTTDTFDVLLDLMTDSTSFPSKKRLIIHQEALVLCFDLIPWCDISFRFSIFRSLQEILISCSGN